MCFRTKDNRIIHTTAANFLSRTPREGRPPKIDLPKHTKRITAYLNNSTVTGAITDFDLNAKVVIIRPADAVDDSDNISVPFGTPAERA